MKSRIKIEKKEYIYLGSILIFIVIMILSMIYVQRKLSEVGNIESKKSKQYENHYVLITGNEDNEFWESVYQGAKKEAELHNSYVERLGNNLVAQLDKTELLEIAIDANVDGIIIDGDNEERMAALINKAVDNDIPVVTVRDDCTNSKRQTYVGISSYNLGREYANQIHKTIQKENDEKLSICVLMDSFTGDLGQDIVITGIRERLAELYDSSIKIEIEGIFVDNSTTFSAEERIRDIFIEHNQLPDALICLTSIYTKCAYQAVVDHNKVGDIVILGYYDTNAILEAVSKNIVQSTIAIDTEEMGSLCVTALSEIQRTEYFSSYLAVEADVIEEKQAKELLENNTKE